MRLDESFLKKVLPEAEIMCGTLGKEVAFSLDSRTIKNNELFVPVQGDNADGHNFLERALQKGCGALIAHNKKELLKEIGIKLTEQLVIAVNDPQEAFFSLASAWRAQFTIPLIAVTGSVGKTSTKLLLSNILKAAGKNCFTSFGNQNTLFGVSLNMARLNQDYEVAIFEVGVSEQGEMARIVERLQPTTALVTCIGHSHMEGLGSLNNIAAEKRDIFKFFKEDSIGIINGDQPLLSSVSFSHPMIRFGTKTTNQIQARKVKVFDDHVSFLLKIYNDRYQITLPNSSREFIQNVLAAAAVTHYLDVDHSIIVQEIQKPLIRERRFQSCPLKDYNGVLIDDAYNASPESMKAALLALQRLKVNGKKIAVIGDMLELGQNSPFWHRQIGRFLRKVPSLEHLILVGDQVQWTQKTAPTGIDVEVVPSWKDAAKTLREKLNNGSVVLVKGSSGMNLSHLVNEFADTNKAATL